MKTWKTRRLEIGLGVVFTIGIAIVAWVRLQLPDQTTPAATLDIEIAKTALTGCIVAVIGAVIGMLVKEREQRIQETRLQAELLTQFLQELGEHYRSVKAVRRRLRSFGLTTRYGNPPDILDDEQLKAYQEAMATIEESQLTIEAFRDQFENLPLFNAIKGDAEQLKMMEQYLNFIKKEYDENMSEFRGATEGISFSRLPRLDEFTKDASAITTMLPSSDEEIAEYEFRTHFSGPYHHLWGSISRNMHNLIERV